MAEATSFTSERMLAMEGDTLFSVELVGENLVLKNNRDEVVFSGSVRGLPGIRGVSGEVTEAELAAAITAAHAHGAITGDQLANSSITGAKIPDDAVDDTAIATGAVTTDKIVDAAVTSGKIASGAVSTAAIADDSVVTAKIANGAVTSAKFSTPIVSATNIRYARQGDLVTVYTVGSGYDYTTPFTLPVGFRPAVACSCAAMNTPETSSRRYIVISSGGAITLTPAAAPTQVHFSITFKGA